MNWGKGLFISMTLFILFIVGLVIYMLRDNDSLYEQNYYEKGEAYTETMVEKENASQVMVKYTSERNLTINLGDSGLIAQVLLKHMGDKNLDRTITNKQGEKRVNYVLEVKPLHAGIWYVEVAGTLHDKPFFKKQELIVP